jgi:predicted DNA-binding ribbon-helix-helix protein
MTKTTLYDQDFYRWIETTVSLLRSRKFNQLDLDNLIEEIEDMGKSQKQALMSNLRVLLMHLLKWKYQSDLISNSWRYTIREHRKRIQKALLASPSLKNYYLEVFDESYQDARELAADETGLPLDTFPDESPITEEDTLNPDYLPE